MGRGQTNLLYSPVEAVKRPRVALLPYKDLPTWIINISSKIDLGWRNLKGDYTEAFSQSEKRDFLLRRIPVKNGPRILNIRQRLAVHRLQRISELLASPSGERWADAEALNRVNELLKLVRAFQTDPKASSQSLSELIEKSTKLITDAEERSSRVKKAWAVQIAVTSLRYEFAPYSFERVEPSRILTELSKFYEFFELSPDDAVLSQEQLYRDEMAQLIAGLEEIAI